MMSDDELDAREVELPALRGRALFLVFAAILTLIGMAGVAIFFAVRLTTPNMAPTITASPSSTPSATNPPPTLMATPVVMRVCTDIPDGRLHVRFAAGDGSEVRGYLAEDESVLPTANTETLKGETWQQITSPIAGWVNARYLCPAE